MIELSVSLASNGAAKLAGYEQMLRFGYTKNRGVYRLAVTASGEWEGLTIRAFWHTSDGKDPPSSLVVDGYVNVPAGVTAQPGNGCITFEGSDGTKTVTSADLRYRVSANSGTEDGTEPEPGTPAWQQLVDAVHTDAAAAEQAKTDAQNAAKQSEVSAKKAGQALSDTNTAKEDALKAIGDKQTTATQAVDTARDKALQQVEASTKAAKNAASEAGDAQAKAAESLQELKDGIASGNFKGEPGTSPTVTVQDIAGGHRIVITDATGTSFVDVLNGKQGDPGKPGDTGLTIGTVEEGDAPSATITGTAKNPVLNLTLKSGAPGKDSTVDATLSQSGQAADAKVTGDELATKAVIDDTAVDTDAWSSKHIVDMLCPPLEETGNLVQCYPVAGYPLGCKVSWEPTQEGSGDPSPDNVRPIKGRDSVAVERCGENLVKFPYSTSAANRNGLVITSQQDGSITVNGTATADTWHAINRNIEKRLPVNTALTLSGCPAGGSTKSYYIGLYLGGKWYADTGNGNIDIKFTTPEIVSRVELSIIKGTVCNNLTFYPKIEVGTTITPYSKYTGQTTALTLPRTIYGGTVDAVTGEGQETWGLIDSYAEEDLPGKWISDRDVYASGTAPTTGAQVAYKLTEPISFTATGVQPISALSGVNTILTDADSATVTGRAAPIKRITDLEDAVASMTTT